MGIFLRQSHNIKPPRWGSFADVQYAIRVNSEKIYDCDPDDDVLVMPLFWGLPALDYSGYNNHCTNYGATYKDGSLDFDGTSSFVKIPYDASINITDKLTVSARIYFRTYPAITKYRIIHHNLACSLSYHGPSEKITFGFWQTTTPDEVLINWPSLNTWHDIVGTHPSIGGKVKVYVDGIKDATESTVYKNIPSNSNPIHIGIDEDETTQIFDGFMGEVRIAKATRTADQIALFNDNKYGLYQKVSRPIWSIPAAPPTFIPQIIMF